VVGRVAVFSSAEIGWISAALLDTGFLFVFAVLVGREVIVGDNRRNLKVVGLVLMLALANAGFHIESAMNGSAAISTRAGLAIIVFLILLIGGRVVPSFTHNWLAKQGTSARPVPFGRFDGAAIVLSGLALLAWIAAPDQGWTGALLLAAGICNLWRLARWRGWTTISDRLVLVLHVGFFFAALGFLFAGTHALWPDVASPAAGVHIWAIGAIGTMTLAMMTRATLGHTGHDLVASRATQLIYLAVVVAMLARVLMEFMPALMQPLLYGAATAWILAFAGFVFVYGPMLAQRAGHRSS
jgi:uncharacterized protein involved in response to NO